MSSSMVAAIALPVPYELYRLNWLSAGESRQLSTTLDVTSAVPFNEGPSRNDRATVKRLCARFPVQYMPVSSRQIEKRTNDAGGDATMGVF